MFRIVFLDGIDDVLCSAPTGVVRIGSGVGQKSAMVKPVASQGDILEDEVHFVERFREIAMSVLR